MNLIPFIQFFLDFLQHEFFNGLYVAWIGMLILGSVFALFRKKRYVNV